MKIINPLYDKAFKYLMENNRLARKVLSVLLDKEVLEVTLGYQETHVPDEKRGITLFRLDFKALIKDDDGKTKKVLIELQKSKYPTDIQRFRNYLGANYMQVDLNRKKKEKTGKKEGRGENELYPIITIYIMGYEIDDIPYLAVTVNRDVINSVNKKRVKIKSFFIEHLTHTSHIIQITRLPKKRQTRLEKFLTLFNQAWVSEENYILDLEEVPEEFRDIATYLQGPVMDAEFRRQLKIEEEIDTIFDKQEAKYLKQIEEAKQKEAAAKQREAEERRLKEEAKQREEEAKQREAAALQREKNTLIKLAIQMKKHNVAIEEIMKETGLSEEEIINLEV